MLACAGDVCVGEADEGVDLTLLQYPVLATRLSGLLLYPGVDLATAQTLHDEFAHLIDAALPLGSGCPGHDSSPPR